jgi:large subunit ribosomal protein L22
MITRSIARYVRISPTKVRSVILLIKGKPVSEALTILSYVQKGASIHLKRLIQSAISNTKKIPHLKVNELYISKLIADEGPMMKRFKAQAMGRATAIRKRTTHITLELDKIKT